MARNCHQQVLLLGKVPLGRTKQLLDIWNLLEPRGMAKEFAIVLINKHSTNISLAKAELEAKFGPSIPWYSFPFDGRDLCRILKIGRIYTEYDDPAGSLIVIEPGKPQSLSYFAFEIIDAYDYHAYPFTLERAVITEKSRQEKQMVLQDFLTAKSVRAYRGDFSVILGEVLFSYLP